MSEIEAIIARDAEVHYCATCTERVYDPTDITDAHNITLARCEAVLKKHGRQPDEKGLRCGAPLDHHPFVEGPIPDWHDAERDRRTLLIAMGLRALPGSDRPSVLDVLTSILHKDTEHPTNVACQTLAKKVISGLREHDIHILHISQIDEFPALTVGPDGEIAA